ncbi:hypothetical protein D3C72_1394930 [compost metagenome]
MYNPIVKSLVTGVAAAVVLAGCSHGAPSATVQTKAASAVEAQSADADRPYIQPSKSLGGIAIEDDNRLGLTPEKAETKARERASEWRPDAELRFVAWGVLKWQLLSAVSHIFYSPSTKEILVVKTLLREKWQNADAYDHVVVTKPAAVLQPLKPDYKIPGARALKLARNHFFFGRPVTLMTLSHPPKLPFAFWGAIGGNVGEANVVLVHANTGQSISAKGIDPFPKEWNR